LVKLIFKLDTREEVALESAEGNLERDPGIIIKKINWRHTRRAVLENWAPADRPIVIFRMFSI
jgi:hypothetical protein